MLYIITIVLLLLGPGGVLDFINAMHIDVLSLPVLSQTSVSLKRQILLPSKPNVYFSKGQNLHCKSARLGFHDNF